MVAKSVVAVLVVATSTTALLATTPNASTAKNQIKMAQQAKWPIVQKLVIAA